ncbi:MAG TPA: hypothetical protein V6D14_22475 [Coleofasciculaceae cyanobacterium]
MKYETRHSSLLLHLNPGAIAQSSHVGFHVTYCFTSKDVTSSTQPTARGDRTRSNTPPWYAPIWLCLQQVAKLHWSGSCDIRLMLDKIDIRGVIQQI